MNRNTRWAALAATLLSSCAANFGSHLEQMQSRGLLSPAGSSKTFAFSDGGSQSQRINYAYSKIFSAYSEYTKNKEEIEDTLTASLIRKRLIQAGMKAMSASNDPTSTIFSYRQILGWDMGEIVKQMTICAESRMTGDPQIECATFSELTMVNSHPTRPLIVNNLLAILLTSKWPTGASPDRYSKTRMEPQQ